VRDSLLGKVNETTEKDAQNTSTSASSSEIVGSEETTAVRKLLRINDYIKTTGERGLTDLKRQVKLNHDLVDFSVIADERRKEYFNNLIHGHQQQLDPVPITHDAVQEQGAVENQTKQEITRRIYELLEQLDLGESELFEEVFKKTVKSKTKEDYINFYYTMLEQIDDTHISGDEDD
jgi:hypothetical protein